jgi:GNAT superfamily N-acetyltransferase
VTGDAADGAGGVAGRIARFGWEQARGQATDVVETGWGFAVLHRSFPASQHHNRMVVTDASVGPAEVAAAAETVFADAGLPYRRVDVEDPTGGPGGGGPGGGGPVGPSAAGVLAAGLGGAVGAAAGAEIVMALVGLDGPARRRGAPGVGRRTVETITVQRPPFERTRALIDRSWQIELPALGADERRQLVDRVPVAAQVRELTQHTVSADGEVVALCHLLRSADCAEVEGVFTLPEVRGRGYATAVVLDAVDLAAASGCDVAFLYADADDWPQHLYRRLGFAEVGRNWTVLWRTG